VGDVDRSDDLRDHHRDGRQARHQDDLRDLHRDHRVACPRGQLTHRVGASSRRGEFWGHRVLRVHHRGHRRDAAHRGHGLGQAAAGSDDQKPTSVGQEAEESPCRWATSAADLLLLAATEAELSDEAVRFDRVDHLK
jgi:hypothetical protein